MTSVWQVFASDNRTFSVFIAKEGYTVVRHGKNVRPPDRSKDPRG